MQSVCEIDDDGTICHGCSGSGEGCADGTRCLTCGGGGLLFDCDEFYEPDRRDEYRDEE